VVAAERAQQLADHPAAAGDLLAGRAGVDADGEAVDGAEDNVGRVRVALNLVYLVPGETGGMEVYARELIPRLAAVDGLELVALVNREAAEDTSAPWGNAVPAEVVPVRARNRVEWVRGEQQHVPRLAAAARADLIHSLASTAPLRSSMRRITTIHDLNYKLVPDAHFGLRALGMRLLVPASARFSHRILVDAQSTRRDLARHLGTPLGKVDVAPLGVTPSPPVRPTPEAQLRARLALGDADVVLTVSAKRPHKNLLRLLEAVALLPGEPVVVLPGYPTPHEAELRERAAALGVRAVFPAWVSAEDLEGLYALAAAFAFPSLAEGFGLPVLEAMARGVPVACSDRSSLPEVAGDAAVLFDPEDPRAIAAALRRLLEDRALAERLREAGRERAASFTWERCAELTAAAYARALAA
jgi:glycosyltransferase involved in cell wall biosynthesis